jgi:hypothetical protein
MKVYQIWYETDIGGVFSSRDKAIAEIEKYGDKYDPDDPSGYPDIQEFELDVPPEHLLDR